MVIEKGQIVSADTPPPPKKKEKTKQLTILERQIQLGKNFYP